MALWKAVSVDGTFTLLFHLEGKSYGPRWAGKAWGRGHHRKNETSLFLNWSIIALQYFFSFCCTTTWISFMYTYIPSFLSLPPTPHPTPLGHHRAPSWDPCAIQQLTTICFTHGSVYMSMRLSQFILPSLSLIPCPQVCSLCLHLYFCPASSQYTEAT